jgi:3-(methylthio)propanoyl-CoA dehydrogenase
VQVLGGAGYTHEWPAEQAVRDARVLAVFEGTTGIQALDLVHRRLRRGEGLAAFIDVARKGEDAGLQKCLDLLEDAGTKLRAMTDAREIDAGATAFLNLAGLAATGWIAARLITAEGEAPATKKMRSAGRYWLNRIAARAVPLHSEAIAGAKSLAEFGAVRS